MTFGAPYLLVALIAVPLAALGYRRLEQVRARRSASWSSLGLLPNMVSRPPRRLGYVPLALWLVGLTFLLVGFARPQRVLPTVHGGAPTVVLAFDVSGSMAAQDVQPNRVRAARAVAVRFLDGLPARYRVALVVFGENARLAVRPTLDHGLVLAALPARVTAKAPTAIGDAVADSVAVITAAVGQSGPGASYHPGAVLVLSDGGQTAGGTTPAAAASTAYLAGIPIDSVPIGTANGVVNQTFVIGGERVSAQLSAPVERATLRLLAGQTGGVVIASPTQSQLQHVYRNLRSPLSFGHRRHELSTVAGAVAIVFLLAGVTVSGFWFGRLA